MEFAHLQADQSAGSAIIGEMGIGFRGRQRDCSGDCVEIDGIEVASSRNIESL